MLIDLKPPKIDDSAPLNVQIQQIKKHLTEQSRLLNYALKNLDEKNMSEKMKSELGISKE